MQDGKSMYKQPESRVSMESGDSGVFVTCDMGREGKCIREAVDVFSHVGPPRIGTAFINLDC
jgi:tRNA acetyltransferase TAN1